MKNVQWKVYFLAIVLISCSPMVISPDSTDAIHSTNVNATPPTSAIVATFVLAPTCLYTVTPTVLETSLPPASTVTPNSVQAREQDEIRAVIQGYFDLRYSLFSISPPGKIEPEIFSEFVSKENKSEDFLMTETAKMAVERTWYELKGLRYAKYEYSLKYSDITVDTESQTAMVALSEYFEIICERAIENNLENPSPCAVGELSHKIILNKEEGEWKIISDIYRDSWWHQFRKSGMSVNEILEEIKTKKDKLEATPLP